MQFQYAVTHGFIHDLYSQLNPPKMPLGNDWELVSAVGNGGLQVTWYWKRPIKFVSRIMKGSGYSNGIRKKHL
jgi:hypothetical protein